MIFYERILSAFDVGKKAQFNNLTLHLFTQKDFFGTRDVKAEVGIMWG